MVNNLLLQTDRILLSEIHKNLISEMQDSLQYIRYLQMHKNLILEMRDNQAHINIDHRQLINIEVRWLINIDRHLHMQDKVKHLSLTIIEVRLHMQDKAERL